MGDNWGFILAIFVASESTSQYFKNLQRIHQTDLSSNFQLVSDLGLLLTTMVFETLLLLLIPTIIHYKVKGKDLSLWDHFRTTTSPLGIEMLRVIARVIRWGVLFILPGIYKHFRYYLVPYVVMFSEDYQQGKVDALDESERLLKGFATPFFLFIAGEMLLQYLVFSKTDNAIFSQQPVVTVLAGMAKLLYNLFVYTVFYSYFAALLERKRGELAVAI